MSFSYALGESILDERLDFLWGRRKAGQIEGDAPDQRATIRGLRWSQSLFVKSSRE